MIEDGDRLAASIVTCALWHQAMAPCARARRRAGGPRGQRRALTRACASRGGSVARGRAQHKQVLAEFRVILDIDTRELHKTRPQTRRSEKHNIAESAAVVRDRLVQRSGRACWRVGTWIENEH